MRDGLLVQHGLRLDQVAGVCAEVKSAEAANRPKRRRLVQKTKDAALVGQSGIEEGLAFRTARVFKAREGKARYTGSSAEGQGTTGGPASDMRAPTSAGFSPAAGAASGSLDAERTGA